MDDTLSRRSKRHKVLPASVDDICLDFEEIFNAAKHSREPVVHIFLPATNDSQIWRNSVIRPFFHFCCVARPGLPMEAHANSIAGMGMIEPINHSAEAPFTLCYRRCGVLMDLARYLQAQPAEAYPGIEVGGPICFMRINNSAWARINFGI